MEYTRKDAKAWARENLKGMVSGCNQVFTHDKLELDETGLRHDVNHLVGLEVGGIYFAGHVTLTPAEWRQFVKVGVEAAAGRTVTVVDIHPDSMSEFIPQAEYAQSVGADLLNVITPPSFRASREQDIFDIYKRLAQAVDIGISLFINPKAGYTMSPQMVADLAELDTIVATKNSAYDNLHTLETFRLAGDKLIIGVPGAQDWAIFVEHGMQMSMGTPHARMFQTHENRWAQEYWDALMEHDWQQAWQIHQERIKPLLDLFWRTFGPYFHQAQVYPLGHYKYWEGLLGMNGGPMRQPMPTLRSQDKHSIRNSLIRTGLITAEQAEEAERRMELVPA